ncbi:MORN repeat protein [Leptospira kirschneri]|uniref:MORN repeat protein n=1 Tax=Leptospira kirschneri serovar Bulgarica str. Nikolaevo TaxID=1240687 RepID=M6F7Z3_9LEPT|nr:MORN repeat protein [Leptospira kirschneri]EMK22423.1 MORN repeat protein [Leptospira kirschneri serovar Bulgarica str. Nikolaevo]EMK24530.1 MORN repeat protein [Leptospira kirschneri serovar Bulgarica str. Nikolaevo]EMK24872.1 MORN repeat protein [Leptospira kirschneri serovar Bulgarica str. Nikolaevo]
MKTLLKFISITAFLFSIAILADEKVKTCIEGDCQNGKGKLQNENGDIAEGVFKNGRPHGLIKAYRSNKPDKISTMYFNNGKIDTSKPVSSWYEDGDHFEGFYNSDMNPQGKGKLTYLNDEIKCVYEGQFHNGKKHGMGKVNCENGISESGQWREGNRFFKIDLEFVCRSLERVDKWEGGTVNGKFTFRIMRNGEDLKANIKKWEGIQIFEDWNDFTIAEAVYNNKNVIATFLLFIPSEMDKTFDTFVSKKRELNIEGRVIGVAYAEKNYPILFVERVQ